MNTEPKCTCDLHNIVEVVILQLCKNVNDRFDQGWILLKTYTECYDPEFAKEHQYVNFVLGRPKSVKPFIEIEKEPLYGTKLV